MKVCLIFEKKSLDAALTESLIREAESRGIEILACDDYGEFTRERGSACAIGQEEMPQGTETIDRIYCSSDAVPFFCQDRKEYLSVMLPALRKSAKDSAIVLFCPDNETAENLRNVCEKYGIEIRTGEAVKIDIEEIAGKPAHVKKSGDSVRSVGSVRILAAFSPNAKDLEARLKSVPGAETEDTASTREEMIKKAVETKPHIVAADFALPGGCDFVYAAKTIPFSVRIIMPYSGNMTEVERERLEEFGVEFFDGDPSLEELERIVFRKQGIDQSTPADSSMETGQPIAKVIRGVAAKTGLSVKTAAGHFAGIKAAVAEINKDLRFGNMIAIVSPAPCGRSFVAGNLAYKFAELGRTAALIDFSETKAAFSHFRMPAGTDDLKRALEYIPREQDEGDEQHIEDAYAALGFTNRRIRGLKVYTCDPAVVKGQEIRFYPSCVKEFLEYLSRNFDYVVADTSPATDKRIMEYAGIAVYVVDCDAAHIHACMASADKYAKLTGDKACLLAINKAIADDEIAPLFNADISRLRVELGINEDNTVSIPHLYHAAACGQAVGIPACAADAELSAAFTEMAEILERR